MRATYTEALKALIEADSLLAGTVFVGEVDGDPARYVLIFPSTLNTGDALTGPQTDHEIRVTIHSVGTTAAQAEWVADRVSLALLNRRPQVAGRKCDRIRHDSADPIRFDPSTSPRVFFAADDYVVRSTKA